MAAAPVRAASSPTESAGGVELKRTLGLTGVTINAMALIAPGAFLWLSFQIQAAQADPGGASTALDMWTGIVFALVLAFLTAVAYAELARIYPEAGAGSCYYFAEQAFLDKEEAAHRRWARLAKFVTGWAAHLFYWVYPGVMVAFAAILVGYLLSQFGITLGTPALMVVAVLFAVAVGAIAARGITGSTLTSFVINVVQLTTLVAFAVLAVAYRLLNPQGASFVYPSAASVVLPHSLTHVLLQSSVAILILVGFESATALGAEAKNPRAHVPRAVLLSLVIQGLFAYLIGYFAANFMISDQLTGTAADGTPVTGMAAAAASAAPIGDLLKLAGDALLGGLGFPLMIVMAVSVALAVLGTTLACVNTAVRVSYAMAQDREMPEPLGLLHGRYATPYVGVWILVAVSAVIGCIGVVSVVNLTAITLASNLGTFVLYGLTFVWAVVAFAGRRDFSVVKHAVVPALGLLANLVMLGVIFGLGLTASGDLFAESALAIGIAGGWALVSAVYFVLNSRSSGRPLVGEPEPAATAADARPA
jgi:basic amino acid/polyamine antiporter, APA family